jgi:hypothetical protein
MWTAFAVEFIFAVEEIVVSCTAYADIVFALQTEQLSTVIFAVATSSHHLQSNYYYQK